MRRGNMDELAGALAGFLQDVYDAPELLWAAALVQLEAAAAIGRESRWGGFGARPDKMLAEVEHVLAQGLDLARLACRLQTAENDRSRDLYRDLHEQAADAARAARRAQTLPAERERAGRRRDKPSNDLTSLEVQARLAGEAALAREEARREAARVRAENRRRRRRERGEG